MMCVLMVEQLSITYSLESEQDLGDDPSYLEVWIVMGSNGGGGSSKVTKVGEKKYVGMTTTSGHGSDKRLNVANVWWDIEE